MSNVWVEQSFWGLLLMLAIMLSALFSGLETGFYTLNRVRLHLRSTQPGSGATTANLLKKPNQLLGTLLIGTNLSNYLASFSLVALIHDTRLTEWQQIGIETAVLTPILFIFAEVLPKNIFANFADLLTYPFARSLRIVQCILLATGLLSLINLISTITLKALKVSNNTRYLTSRRDISQLFKEGIEKGLISDYQSDIIDRVLHPTQRTVKDVMVDWKDVQTMHLGQPPEAVWALADRVPWSRFPLLNHEDTPIGLLNVYTVLVHDPDSCPALDQLMLPLPHLPINQSLRDALITLQKEYSAMGLVIDNDKPVGIITHKDLVEPITGELDIW